jgi:hypothetical protein
VKVVIDTNVFVSSFFGGNPKAVIDLWKNGQLTLCLTNPIIREYIDVLHRAGIGDEGGVNEILFLFRKGYCCAFTATTPRLRVVSDPDDDMFVEAAVALQAEVIVSGDAALSSMGEYAGIPILKPRAFLDFFSRISG